MTLITTLQTNAMSKGTNNKVTDRHKFWLATGLCVAGVALLFTGLFVGTAGIISGSVIGGSGELFVTAGAILGIDAVYSKKLSDIISEVLKGEETKEG